MGLKWTQKMTFLTEKNFGKMNFVKDLCEKKDEDNEHLSKIL